MGRRPNAWRCPSAVRAPATAPSDRAGVAAGQVRPDDRGTGRVDGAPQAVLDEREAGLDARAAGREAAEDLADGLDRLEIGLHGELDPRAGGRRPARSGRRRRRRVARGGSRRWLVVGGPRAHLRPSLSRRPACRPTSSPDASRVRLERLALLLGELARHVDPDEDVEIALRRPSAGGGARPCPAGGARCPAGCPA